MPTRNLGDSKKNSVGHNPEAIQLMSVMQFTKHFARQIKESNITIHVLEKGHPRALEWYTRNSLTAWVKNWTSVFWGLFKKKGSEWTIWFDSYIHIYCKTQQKHSSDTEENNTEHKYSNSN